MMTFNDKINLNLEITLEEFEEEYRLPSPQRFLPKKLDFLSAESLTTNFRRIFRQDSGYSSYEYRFLTENHPGLNLTKSLLENERNWVTLTFLELADNLETFEERIALLEWSQFYFVSVGEKEARSSWNTYRTSWDIPIRFISSLRNYKKAMEIIFEYMHRKNFTDYSLLYGNGSIEYNLSKLVQDNDLLINILNDETRYGSYTIYLNLYAELEGFEEFSYETILEILGL